MIDAFWSRVVRRLFVDDRRVLEQVLEGHDPALDEGLLVLRLFVFGVVLGAGQLFGLVDAVGDLRAADVAEVLQLLLEALDAVLGQGYSLLGHLDSPGFDQLYGVFGRWK